MKSGQRWAVTDWMARFALTSLVTATLAFVAPCRADDAPVAGNSVATVVSESPSSDAMSKTPDQEGVPRTALRHRSTKRLTLAQSLDEGVGRLTRGLDLDPGQQESLRQILVDQHRRIMKLRSANSAAATDVTGTMLAIYDQTKARIRAMLNDEQKKKYSADVPHGDLAPAQADLKHWMDLQESKRRQDHAEGDTK